MLMVLETSPEDKEQIKEEHVPIKAVEPIAPHTPGADLLKMLEMEMNGS